MDDLITAIKNLHDCNTTYSESADIKEEHEGQTVWEGTVHVFDVDHPDSDTCYAWSSPIDDSKERQYYAVLKIPPIDLPINAVRASIVSDHKS